MKIKYYLAKAIKFLHLSAILNSDIHHTAKVATESHLVNITIDKYSYVGNKCTIIDTEIGSYSSIADNVIIGGASHPIDWVSTSPVFHHGKNILNKNFSTHGFKATKKTVVGHDVWIGNNCLIKSGIIIETGAIVGMGAVVTKNIGPYEIWAGNPAKLIRKRFDDDVIASLLNLRWWEWDETKLEVQADSIKNPLDFINNCDES